MVPRPSQTDTALFSHSSHTQGPHSKQERTTKSFTQNFVPYNIFVEHIHLAHYQRTCLTHTGFTYLCTSLKRLGIPRHYTGVSTLRQVFCQASGTTTMTYRGAREQIKGTSPASTLLDCAASAEGIFKGKAFACRPHTLRPAHMTQELRVHPLVKTTIAVVTKVILPVPCPNPSRSESQVQSIATSTRTLSVCDQPNPTSPA